MRSLLVTLILLLCLVQAHGLEFKSVTCPDFVERREGTQIQQIYIVDTQTCYLSITPLNAFKDLIYRDFLFSSQGLMMVFNSYGPGNDSDNTAAREFLFFPRLNQSFAFSWEDAKKELRVTHITGDVFVFDSASAAIKSMTRAQVSVEKDIVPTNKGGVEISNFEGLLLDGGFAIGSSPTANPRRSAVFRDSAGTSCKIGNEEIFNYTKDGDALFKFDDLGLQTFLKNRCPKLRTF